MDPREMLLKALTGGLSDLAQEEIWTNYNQVGLLEAWNRKVEDFHPEPGTIIKFERAVERIAICMGGAPIIVNGTGPHLPFYREAHDCLVGYIDPQSREFTLASWPGWAVSPTEDGFGATKLRELAKTYNDPVSAVLRPGDLCKWKPEMKDRKQDGVFIVTETFEPRFAMEREQQDLPDWFHMRWLTSCKIMIDRAGIFATYVVDKNRLMPA